MERWGMVLGLKYDGILDLMYCGIEEIDIVYSFMEYMFDFL